MTDEEAIARARAIAEERGWTWATPVRVRTTREGLLRRRKVLEVWSNAEAKGTNVVIAFDAETGEVVRAAFLPR